MSDQATWPAPLEFDAAIAAHRTWLRHLEFAVAGIESEQIDFSTVGDPMQCPLGQWLNGLPSELLADDLREVAQLHSRLHGLLNDVASLVAEGRSTDAENVLTESAGPLSAALCDRLEVMKHRVAASQRGA